jgi:O-succinylbenzoic acid--CoA ligase
MPRALLDRATDVGVPVALTWGMTETTGQVATAAPDEVAALGGRTVGRPLEGMEVRVDEGGRLAVRGAMVAAGQVEAPGAGLTPLVHGPGRWLTTGDLGRIDDEGRVLVAGRADQMIITGGVNVNPRDVEAVLRRAAGVAEAVVWGVRDPRWGEVVCAAVVADPGQATPVAVEALHRHCRAHLTRSRCPTNIVLVPAIPRTPTGKPALTRLPDLLSPFPE